MIASFDDLFGLPSNKISPFCILTPFLTKGFLNGLGASKIYRGNPYQTVCGQTGSLIETRVGCSFAGDAVLLLNGSPCRRLLFVGSCGSLDSKKFPIGSVITLQDCYAMEKFSAMLNPPLAFDHIMVPDKDFFHELTSMGVTPARGASVGSIVLESVHQSDFQKNGIQVLDLECASVFAAAAHVRIPAAAILYVTDIVGQTSPFVKPTGDHAKKITTATTSIVDLIKRLGC